MTRGEPPLRRIGRSVRNDLKYAWRALLRNSVAASPLTPRVVRAAIYRVAGYRFETVNLAEGLILNNSFVRIGAETSISRGCYFEGRGLVDIGPSCMIGQEVAFLTSKHGVSSDGTVDRIPTYLPITVGAGSWIGARATVLGGAEIGPGVIVTAGSVISGVCTGGFVYSGVPARKIGRTKALGRAAPAHRSTAGTMTADTMTADTMTADTMTADTAASTLAEG
jgi:maltose O-acetyltransferase